MLLGISDQESGVEYLQIRRGRLYWRIAVPSCNRIDHVQGQTKRDNRDYLQIDVKINGFLVVKGDQFAFALGVILRGAFCLAMAIG